MTFLTGLFKSSLRVTDGGVVSLPDDLRSHQANQRATREWTIKSSTQGSGADHHRLTKLALKAPGLTIVRVRPDRDPSIAARVVASSDAPQHLERLAVSVKHKNELRVVFKNPTTNAPLGTLVVEIELTCAEFIDKIKAKRGGDVVVVEQNGSVVLSRRDDASITLAAQDPHSRLFVLNDDMETPGIAAKSLRVASVSGGSVFISSAHALVGRDHLASVVLGDGSVVIRAPSVETKELLVAVVGERGHADLLTPAHGVTATNGKLAVVGNGSILVQTSPQLEREPNTTSCDRLKVKTAGAGCVDVAALAAREVHVKAKDGARVVVQARERLEIACDVRSTVECVGGLPTQVTSASQHSPGAVLVPVDHEARVRTASGPVPDAPTPQMMYDAPRVLHAKKMDKKIGFRKTLNAAKKSHSDGKNGAAHPVWVSVAEAGKSLD